MLHRSSKPCALAFLIGALTWQTARADAPAQSPPVEPAGATEQEPTAPTAPGAQPQVVEPIAPPPIAPEATAPPPAPEATAPPPAPEASPPRDPPTPPPVSSPPRAPEIAPAASVTTPGATPTRRSDGVRIALAAALLALPRPLEIELGLVLRGTLGLAGQYSMLPELTFPGRDAKVKLRAFQGIVRWFPFRGRFHVGCGVGYQQLAASFEEELQGTPLRVAADMSGLFVSPQVGWTWVWRSGLSVSLGFGAQIPIGNNPNVEVTYAGMQVPEQTGPGTSDEVAGAARDGREQVRTITRAVGKYPFPNIDLLKIGFYF